MALPRGAAAVTELLILGEGPHAREMLDIVRRVNARQQTWDLLGFATTRESLVGGSIEGFPVLEVQAAMERYPLALVTPEYEWPRKLEIPRSRLASLIDPAAVISSTATIGLGCVIFPHCYVGAQAQIGDFLFCLSGSVINHNVVIEDCVTVTSGVVVAGDVHVEADCYLGQSSVVREQLRIGKNSLLGMGSVVLHNVAPNSVMVGNPARSLGARELNLPGMRLWKSMKRLARKGLKVTRRTFFGRQARSAALRHQ
jgi:sugar O-acyltransferase (sialic acid O-acetyltransferase NeuD family)